MARGVTDLSRCANTATATSQPLQQAHPEPVQLVAHCAGRLILCVSAQLRCNCIVNNVVSCSMPACNIVRIACTQEGKVQKFWSVVQGGTLKLGSESEAQCFVTHCETDRSCLIQHLQSGAFVEQGADRKLRLALCPASALPFSKLAAYSEGEGQVTRDSVWLRAATGGIVCSNSQNELAVAVDGQRHDCPARDCAFTFQTVDAQSLLMQGMAPNSTDAHKADSAPRLQYPHSAAVSIAAKPVTSCFANRSAAMPIALKRPIRKVSFSELSAMDHSESYDHQSAPVQSSLPRKSGSFSPSYSLRDAISNRVPHSPGCTDNLSQGSDSDESKVRGGHHFDSDHLSSSGSLSNLEQSLSGLPESSITLSSPCDTLSSSTQSQTTTHGTDASPHGLIPSHTASNTASCRASGINASPSATKLPDSPVQRQQDQPHGSYTQLDSSWDHSEESPSRLGAPVGFDDERSSCGWKTHGGNLFKQGSLRSTQSMSAISSSPYRSPVASHRAMKGHRTHGSQTALNFLAGNCSPSSPHRIPRTAEVPQSLAQSAPVMGEGLLASEGRNLSHGQSHDAHWPSSSSSPGFRTSPPSPSSSSKESSWRLNHPSEGLAALRLSRVSGDSHQREPMLPCIHEGEPSQDPEILQQSAVDTLLSRCGQEAIPLPHNGAANSQLPDAKGPLACGPFPFDRQQPKGKGTFCVGRGSLEINSAFQSKGDFAAQFKDASPCRFNGTAPISGSGSGSASERLCFCSDLQRYIQSHVLFPSLPRPLSGMKRVSSSPDMRESGCSSLHPAIHKVTPRGSPTDLPWVLKRHHAPLQTSSSFSSGLQV